MAEALIINTEVEKKRLLAQLKGVSRPYKRFLGAPIRYGGGKSLAVGHIIERLPAGTRFLASPFIGGGALEVASAQKLGIEVQAYDVFDVLVTFWQVLLAQPEALYQQLAAWAPTPARYNKVKQRLRLHWEATQHKTGAQEQLLDEVSLAAHYYFNHNLSYGPGFLGWMSKIYANKARYMKAINTLRHFRASGLKVSQADFCESIPKHTQDLLYCDPPYYLEGDSKMFKGIYPQRNFPIHHKGFDHIALRDLLHKHKGGFILSYNDCSAIRAWYKDYRIEEIGWQYTMGQGETRIGENRMNGNESHIKASHELLITNL